MRFATLLQHNGHDSDPVTGALGVPIVQSSTFAQKDVLGHQEFDYARSGNPTRKALEETIAVLEGGVRGFAFGSGVAAVASCLGILAKGDHIVTACDIYGGSYRLINTFYKRWGLECASVDASDPVNIKKALKPETKAVFLETPSNPLLKITDLAACIKVAKEAGLIVLVDNTFMTPYLQRPLEQGADIVVHSATKFLGGHSDLVLGLAVTADEALGRRVYTVQNTFGAIPGPQDVWLTLRGIKTLKARLDLAQKTAQTVAEWLSSHKNVASVYYPGLPGHPGRDIHYRQASGAGAVVSFKTKTREAALQFLAKTRLAAPAVSLGAVETIATYPVTMSHAAIPQTVRESLGITDNLIRLSIGLEDSEDLIEDFAQALSG